MTKSFLLILLLILSASTALAQSDSISEALKVVEEFHSEAKGLTTGLADSSFHKDSLESKEKTISEIKSIRLTATPGRKRFERVFSLVEKYMDQEISAVRGLDRTGARKNTKVKKAADRLSNMKGKKLEELQKTLPYETYERKKREPVPLIDTSPYEEEPEKEKGIWYR